MNLNEAREIIKDKDSLRQFPDGFGLILSAKGFLEGHQAARITHADFSKEWQEEISKWKKLCEKLLQTLKTYPDLISKNREGEIRLMISTAENELKK